MAQPIQYTPPPRRIGPSAEEELQRLLETCHRHGLLRFANDLVASQTEVAQVIVDGLANESVLTAIKNACVLLMALSRIPPDQFYRIVFALRDATAQLTEAAAPQGETAHPPGITGAVHMLHDEHLWRALTPIVSALKAFAAGLERPVKNPISEFTGKSGSTQ